MSNKKRSLKPLVIALGAGLALGAASLPLTANANTTSPFQGKPLANGYNVASGSHNHADAKTTTTSKKAEGKCGEGKCGKNKADGKCGAKGKAEGKCGEGKCGGDAKKDSKGKKDGKCGEGKCGH